MPDSLQRAMGTPTEITVEGKVYRLAPLTLGHIADLDDWARRQPFVEVRGKLLELRDLGVSEATKTALVIEADKSSKDPIQIAQRLQSIPGIMRAVGLSLRVNHPGLTDTEVEKIVRSFGVKEMEQTLTSISAVEGDEKK